MTEPTKPTAEEKPMPSWMSGMGHKADMSGDAKKRVPFRFWLNPGTERNILFLTDGDRAPVFWEHQYCAMKNGKLNWGHHLTCLQVLGQQCPMCQYAQDHGKFERSKIQAFTILDLTPWKDSSGKEHPYTKRVLAVKSRVQETIARKYIAQIDKGEKLRGAIFKVFRPNDKKSASTGTEFDFVKMMDLAKLPEGAADEVDWNLFAPDPEKMVSEVARLHGGGEASSATTSAAPASELFGDLTGGPVDDLATGPESVAVDYE